MVNNTHMNHNRVLAGKKQIPKLTDKEKKIARDMYARMFRALAYKNLLKGSTLGQAWYDAMKQMESFVNGKDEYNPAAKELHAIWSGHKKTIEREVMTHPMRDMVIKVPEKDRPMLEKRVSMELASGQGGLNKIVEKYKPIAEQTRAEIKKLEDEKAKLNAAQQEKAKQEQPENTPAVNEPTKVESKTPEKVNKFADATKKLDAMAMEQMKIQLMLALQRQNQRRAA